MITARWLAHEGVGVAGETVAVGREAVAAVAREPALMHGGGGQRLGPMQRATDVWEEQHV